MSALEQLKANVDRARVNEGAKIETLIAAARTDLLATANANQVSHEARGRAIADLLFAARAYTVTFHVRLRCEKHAREEGIRV